jgi:hypothetical protein
MARSSILLSSVLGSFLVLGCDAVGTIYPSENAGDSKVAANENPSPDIHGLQNEVNSPPHQTVLTIQTAGDETTGTFNVPGVGTVNARASKDASGDIRGFFALNGIPYYEAIASRRHPERNDTSSALSVLRLNEGPSRILALATTEIWSQLVQRAYFPVGPDGEPLLAAGGGDGHCRIQTVDCPKDCKTIIFHGECTICFKVDCDIILKETE